MLWKPAVIATLGAAGLLAAALPSQGLRTAASPPDVPAPAALVLDEPQSLDEVAAGIEAVTPGTVLQVVGVVPTSDGELTVGTIVTAGEDSSDVIAEHIAAAIEVSDVGADEQALDVLRVTGSSDDLDELQAVLGGDVVTQEIAAAGDETRADAETAATGTCGDRFTPVEKFYKSDWYDTEGIYRYIRHKIYWSAANLANLKACGGATTYEHEFWEYNYDRKHVLGAEVSWTSGMPNSYLDTSFADSANELGYTIGTARASNLTAGTVYTITIVTKTGNISSGGKGKVQGQKGERVPSICTSTWCIFGRGVQGISNGFTFPIPGSIGTA